MGRTISKKEVLKKIEDFFNAENFSSEDAKKIKKLAMKFNIKLGGKRKKFCKKCLIKLKGKTRVGKMYKTVECSECGYRNKLRLRSS